MSHHQVENIPPLYSRFFESLIERQSVAMTKGNISSIFPSEPADTFNSFHLKISKFDDFANPPVPKKPLLTIEEEDPILDPSQFLGTTGLESQNQSSKQIQIPSQQCPTEGLGVETCQSCRKAIRDQYLLHVNGKAWHTGCLRCSACMTHLGNQQSCFVGKDAQLYCKSDYSRYFGVRCAKCQRVVSSTDWVRRAKQLVYHLACFACNICHRQLSTGEEFALHEHHVLCRQHFMELLDIPPAGGGASGANGAGTTKGGSSSGVLVTSSSSSSGAGGCSGNGSDSNDRADCNSMNGDGPDEPNGCNDLDCGGSLGSPHSHKSKRSRTTFSEDQLKVLQANFNMDSNPDGQDLERIASQTGLSKRVIQVWFQNARSRQKKHLSTGSSGGNHMNGQQQGTNGGGPPGGMMQGGGAAGANQAAAMFAANASAAKLHHHALTFVGPSGFDDVMSPNPVGLM